MTGGKHAGEDPQIGLHRQQAPHHRTLRINQQVNKKRPGNHHAEIHRQHRQADLGRHLGRGEGDHHEVGDHDEYEHNADHDLLVFAVVALGERRGDVGQAAARYDQPGRSGKQEECDEKGGGREVGRHPLRKHHGTKPDQVGDGDGAQNAGDPRSARAGSCFRVRPSRGAFSDFWHGRGHCWSSRLSMHHAPIRHGTVRRHPDADHRAAPDCALDA